MSDWPGIVGFPSHCGGGPRTKVGLMMAEMMMMTIFNEQFSCYKCYALGFTCR